MARKRIKQTRCTYHGQCTCIEYPGFYPQFHVQRVAPNKYEVWRHDFVARPRGLKTTLSVKNQTGAVVGRVVEEEPAGNMLKRTFVHAFIYFVEATAYAKKQLQIDLVAAALLRDT